MVRKAIESVSEEGLVQIILDKTEKLCATEIMCNKFLNGNTVAEGLSHIAHTTDFFTKDQEIPPLPELIVFYKKFPDFYSRISELTKKVSMGTLWDTEMQKDYNHYSKLRDHAKETTFGKIINIKTDAEIKISIVPTSPYLQISLFSEEVFKRTGSDIVFFLTRKGK
jgi:hypothetical protein